MLSPVARVDRLLQQPVAVAPLGLADTETRSPLEAGVAGLFFMPNAAYYSGSDASGPCIRSDMKEIQMISEDVCNELHVQLLKERQQYESEIANLESGGIRGDTFQADEMMDNVDQHPADAATEMFEREKNFTLLRTLQESLQNVNDALHKFDEGTYGLCENCGKPIPEKRLRALPEATYCIECQALMEKRR